MRVGRARATKNVGERKVAPEQSLSMRGRLTSETPASAPEPVTVRSEREHTWSMYVCIRTKYLPSGDG